MESIEEMLARLAGGQEGQTEQRGQEFTLNPTRVREAIDGFLKEDRLLWIKHLLQLLNEEPQVSAPVLSEQADGCFLLNFFPTDEWESECSFQQLEASYAQLFGQSRASRLSRILVELGSQSQYLHYQSPGESLVVGPDALQLEPAKAVLASGVAFHFSFRSLTQVPKLFGWGARQAVMELESLSALHTFPTVIDQGPPIVADWPFTPPTNDDDDRPKLWDWESVVPTEAGGFRWTVASWSQLLSEVDSPSGRLSIIRHPLEVRRAYSQHPILGCYPDSLTQQLQLSDTPTLSHVNLRANRVFGISWSTASPKNSVLIPMIKGVPGRHIEIDEAPAGLYLLAEASHLRTDASGIALVRDEAMQAWKDDLFRWMEEQLALYVPYIDQILSFWLNRAHRWRDVEKPPGAVSKLAKLAVSGLFALSPAKRIVTQRKSKLQDYIARRDSSRP